MATLYHEVWINAPTAKVYQAIATADGIGAWWDEQTAVHTDQGVVLEHNPGPAHGTVKMKVLDLVEDTRVEWECISTHPRSSPASAWTGTHVIFEIGRRSVPPWATERTDMAIVNFRHSGWDEHSAYFGFCNFAWGQALQKLKQVCEAS
jgi:uncharacterized protein YndB with AHSA1/START domain